MIRKQLGEKNKKHLNDLLNKLDKSKDNSVFSEILDCCVMYERQGYDVIPYVRKIHNYINGKR